MASPRTSLQTPDGFVVARLLFGGTWLTGVSPSRQIPSHGSDLFATTYALDFMAVDERGRTAPTCGPATIFGVEPPELFYAFGSPLSAPVDGGGRSDPWRRAGPGRASFVAGPDSVRPSRRAGASGRESGRSQVTT